MTATPIPTTTSPDLVSGFPFPFPQDSYRYSTNVQPSSVDVSTPAGGWGGAVLDVDSEYHRELLERAEILERDPTRAAALPHMGVACWDAMLYLMRELASVRPDDVELTLLERGTRPTYRWRNDLLGIDRTFVLGDLDTLPAEPLAWIASQVQEDIVLLDQRDEMLHADAGVVTFAADWSFGFDVGMTFLEIHGPVPRLHDEGVITRAHEFLKRLQVDQSYRRTNWTLTIGRRLDVATETYDEWGPDREQVQHVDDETFGTLVQLRVEVQHLIRLPESNAVMFLIRTYMLPLADVAAIEPWRTRTAEVLVELPDDMADYKGLTKFRHRAAAWLLAHPGPRATGV